MQQIHKFAIVSRKDSRITCASLVLVGSLSSPTVSDSIVKESISLEQKAGGFRGGRFKVLKGPSQTSIPPARPGATLLI